MEWNRRILVVEDEPLMASLISDLLSREGFTVRHSSDAVSARNDLVGLDPDAVVLDINLGAGPSGIQFGQWVHKTHPHIAIVFLTKTPDPMTAGSSSWEVPAGSAFLAKDSLESVQELVVAIEKALHQKGDAPRHDRLAHGPLSKLTETQYEILRLAAEGYTNAAIAAKRNTSQRTVEQRLQSACKALGIESLPDRNPRAQAIRIFVEAGGLLPGRKPWV